MSAIPVGKRASRTRLSPTTWQVIDEDGRVVTNAVGDAVSRDLVAALRSIQFARERMNQKGKPASAPEGPRESSEGKNQSQQRKDNNPNEPTKQASR